MIDVTTVKQVKDMNSEELVESLGYEELGIFDSDSFNFKQAILDNKLTGNDFFTKTNQELALILKLDDIQETILQKLIL